MKKAQGSFEYVLILASLVLVITLAITLIQGGIISPASQLAQTDTADYLDFTECASSNLVNNPSFETENKATGDPANWKRTNANFYDKTGDNSYLGSRAVLVTNADFYESDFIEGTQNQKFELLAYLKEVNPSSTAVIDIQGYDAAENPCAGGLSGQIITSPQAQYQAFKTTLTTNACAVKLKITLKAQGPSQTIHVDDACLLNKTTS